jgi:hypothetical protein
MNGSAEGVVPGYQATPFIGYSAVHRQDTLLEPKRQFASQPFIKLLPALAR